MLLGLRKRNRIVYKTLNHYMIYVLWTSSFHVSFATQKQAASCKHHQTITMIPALGISWSGGAHCAGRGSGAVLGTLACCHWWRWSRQGTATSPTLSITLVNTGTRWTSECDGAVNIYTNCSPTISRPARSRCGYSGQVQCSHDNFSWEDSFPG